MLGEASAPSSPGLSVESGQSPGALGRSSGGSRAPAPDLPLCVLTVPTDRTSAPVSTEPDALQTESHVHVQLRHQQEALHGPGPSGEAIRFIVGEPSKLHAGGGGDIHLWCCILSKGWQEHSAAAVEAGRFVAGSQRGPPHTEPREPYSEEIPNMGRSSPSLPPSHHGALRKAPGLILLQPHSASSPQAQRSCPL